MQDKYSQLLTQTLSEFQEKQKEHLQNFSEAEEILQPKHSRGKRSIGPAPALSQSQRDSIAKMYSLFHGLKKVAQELSSKFRAQVSKIDISPQTDEDEVKSIERALKEIEWSEETIKTQRERKDSRFFDPKSWRDWETNPFKPFYPTQEEFEKDIQELQENAKNVFMKQQYLTRELSRAVERHWRTPRVYSTLQRQYREQEKKVNLLQASQDAHIVQKVANYLLRSMGRSK